MHGSMLSLGILDRIEICAIRLQLKRCKKSRIDRPCCVCFDNYGLWPQGSGFVSEDSRSYESCSIYSIQGFYAKAVVGLVD